MGAGAQPFYHVCLPLRRILFRLWFPTPGTGVVNGAVPEVGML